MACVLRRELSDFTMLHAHGLPNCTQNHAPSPTGAPNCRPFTLVIHHMMHHAIAHRLVFVACILDANCAHGTAEHEIARTCARGDASLIQPPCNPRFPPLVGTIPHLAHHLGASTIHFAAPPRAQHPFHRMMWASKVAPPSLFG